MTTPLRHTPLLPGTLQNLFYPPDEYDYFARAKEKPFPDCGTLVKAAWAADASMLAYARRGAERMPDADFRGYLRAAGLTECEEIGDWNGRGTQGYFASGDEFAILAFRGTEADDPTDLASDANLILVSDTEDAGRKAYPGTAGGGHLAFLTGMFSKPCRVHLGFREALDSVWKMKGDDVQNKVVDLVAKYRREHEKQEICFTGHSLGAALALLAFSRFVDENISAYTFGCPRVGNEGFRERVMSYPGRGVYRFVNYNDAVTHIPIESLLLPYCQTPAQCYRFTMNGDLDYTDDDSVVSDLVKLGEAVASLSTIVSSWQGGITPNLNAIQAPNSLVDHSPARYCFRLWDCV